MQEMTGQSTPKSVFEKKLTDLTPKRVVKFKTLLNDFRTQLTSQYFRTATDSNNKVELLRLVEATKRMKDNSFEMQLTIANYTNCPLVIRAEEAISSLDDCVYLMQAARISLSSEHSEPEDLAFARILAEYFYAIVLLNIHSKENPIELTHSH
jgi:hypothetical protein